MTKKLLLFPFLIIGVITLAGCSQKTSQQKTDNDTAPTANVNSNQSPMAKTEQTADKIEVVHFHATQQCWSCITVGEYTLKTIKEKFPEEYKNGTIDFQEINVELPENREVAKKFQASGSSLFINAIRNSQDDISQDTNVWRLLGNEDQFKSYLENKLNSLLGK